MGCCGFRQAFPFNMPPEEKLISKFESDWLFENIRLDGFLSALTLPEMSLTSLQKLYESHGLRKQDLSKDSLYSPFYNKFITEDRVSTKYIYILAILLSSEIEEVKLALLFKLYNTKHLNLTTMNELLTDLTTVSLWILLAVPDSILEKETVNTYYNQLQFIQRRFCIQKAKNLMQGMNEVDLDDFKEIFDRDFKNRCLFRSSELRMYMLNKYQASYKAMPVTADIVDLKTSIPRQDSTISTITKQKSVTFSDEIILYHIQTQQQDEIPAEEHSKVSLRVPVSDEGGKDTYQAQETYEGDIENEETSDILRFYDIIVLTHTSNNLSLYHDFSEKDEMDTISLNSIRDDTARWILKPIEKQEKSEIEPEVRYGMEVRLKNICTKMYLCIETIGNEDNKIIRITCKKEKNRNSDWVIEPANDYGVEQWHPSHDIVFKHVNTGLFLCVDMQMEETESQSVVIPSYIIEGNGLWYIESKTVD